MLRDARRWLTAHAASAALRAAPVAPAWSIRAAQKTLAAVGPIAPVLARTVAANMKAVGLYTPEAHRDYFLRVAEHLAAAIHIFRHVPPDIGATGTMAAPLAKIVHEQIKLDDSVAILRQAVAAGRGAIIVGCHITNFLLILARLNEEIPLTVYLRHSHDPRRNVAKERWCRATGLQFVAEAASAADPTRRAVAMAEALQSGRVLVITPDLPQKDANGIPVNFVDRRIWLPNGPAALSLLTGAPLVAAVARPAGRATCLVLEGPYSADVVGKGRGWRQAAIAERMQWFADRFVNYLRAHPSLWFLWGDSRWTRVFRGDPRFSQPASVAEPAGDGAATINIVGAI